MGTSLKRVCGVILIFLWTGLSLTTGCASVIHGTRQKVLVSSRPSGADVSIDGRTAGKTPLEIKLKRKDTHVVVVHQEGYADQETRLDTKISGWFWGNIALGGFVGIAIDALDGAMYKLEPDQVSVQLQKSDGSPAAAETTPASPPGENQKEGRNSLLQSEKVYGIRYQSGSSSALSVAQSFLEKLKQDSSIGGYQILDYVYQSDGLSYLKSGFPRGFVFDFKNLKKDPSIKVRTRLIQFPEAKILWEETCESSDSETCSQNLVGQYLKQKEVL